MKTKLNVCHLLGSVNRGGTEILTLDLCNNFESEEFSLLLIYRKNGQLEDTFLKSNVPVFHIPIKNGNIISYIMRLRSFLVKNDIKIIHTHQPIDALLVILATLFLNIKIVLSHHGYIRSKKSQYLLKFVVPKVNLNFFVSNSCEKLYKAYLKKKHIYNSHILYNGIDPNRLIISDNNQHKEIKYNKDTILMGMVGNFHPATRDQITVCKALNGLANEFFNFNFIFAGGASAEGKIYFEKCKIVCKNLINSNNIQFVGLINNVPQLLSDLDLFIYSTNYDTFGIGLVEAMMTGLPCIVNDHSTLLEISENGKYASIFKTGNENDLKEKIIDLIQNKTKRALLSEVASKYALEMFSIKSHINKLLFHYKILLKNQG